MGMLRVVYYRAALDMESAVGNIHYWKRPEARHHPNYDRAARDEILRHYRAAIAEQMLRPASRMSDVEWKRRQLGQDQFKYSGLSEERARQAISEDMAFLDAHPVKKAKRV